MALSLTAMTPDDWPRMREIYCEGIETGDATVPESRASRRLHEALGFRTVGVRERLVA